MQTVFEGSPARGNPTGGCLKFKCVCKLPFSATCSAGIREKINIFKFERDTLERAGITDTATPVPPFLVSSHAHAGY